MPTLNARRAARLSPEEKHRQQEMCDALEQARDEQQAEKDKQKAHRRAAEEAEDAAELLRFQGGGAKC